MSPPPSIGAAPSPVGADTTCNRLHNKMRVIRGTSAALLLFGLVSSSAAADDFPANARSQVNVIIPSSLHKAGGARHKMSNFGNHPETGSMTLPVYWYFQMCELLPKGGDDPNSKGFPPRPKDPKTGHMQRWQPPFILMTWRGGCTFTAKARHAQMAGASALLIADTHCLCDDKVCMASASNDTHSGACQESEPPMADDGSGGDISIPGFLIHRDDAVPIKDTIVGKKQSVLMNIRWQKPKVNQVRFGVWTEWGDDDWIDEYGPLVNALGDKGHFRAHYVIHNGTRTNCGGGGSDTLCKDMCTNNGRYCYPTHDRNGTAVVLEILRRACIWKHYGPAEGEPTVRSKWFEYVSHYRNKCGSTVDDDAKCAHDALAYASISKGDIDTCMIDSGDPTHDATNVLLDKVLQSQLEFGITVTPRLVVNNFRLKETSASSLFNEICDTTTGWGLCDKCAGDKDPMACIDKTYAVKETHFVRRTVHLSILMGLLGTIAFFAHEAYKRHLIGIQMFGGGGGRGGGGGDTSSLAYSLVQDRGGDDFQPLDLRLDTN
ncbi:hypothetical protein ACHAXT_013084 [Thalassiosira profunda]